MKEQIKTLKIDLSNQEMTINEKPVEGATLEEKLGGFGKAIHDIEEHLQKNPDLIDAYDSRNLLCFDIGCLTGSNVMTSRRTIVSGLSPLKTSKAGTNGIFYSAASGGFGPEIRECGLDSIQLVGKSEKPVYLVIDNEKVSFEDASGLIGKTTNEKIRILADKYESAAFAVIGQAGERQVRFANIAFSTDDQLKKGSGHMRFAGRGGMGAVMGSKNLLGIVVKGDETGQDVGDVKALNMEIAKGEGTKKYREQGTFYGNWNMEAKGVNVHNNFSIGSDPMMEALKKEKLLAEGYNIQNKGCLRCAVRCWKEIVDKEGTVHGKLDFEPGMLLGPNLGINNIKQIMELIHIADSNGLDSMSAGVCIGYEMEENGKFGDFKFAKYLLNKIGKGEHDLKEGVMRYSNNAPNAMHVKGIELPAYPGNFNPGYAFAIAGPHMSIDTYNRAWFPGAENSVNEWVENIMRGPIMILYDMDGLCKFSKVSFDNVAILYERVFGEETSTEQLKQCAKQVNQRARGIDARLGFTDVDDVLPEKCYEPLAGSTLAHFNTKELFDKVKQGVYQEFAKIAIN